MRLLDRIILHCSATPEGRDIDASTIRKWHTSIPPHGRGWSDIGYHYVIKLDGTTEVGRPVDIPGAHVKGHNKTTIGVCYVGGMRDGVPADTMTELQEIAFMELVYSLRRVFGYMPVSGHNEYSSKACPSFNVQKKYGFINLTNEEQSKPNGATYGL